MNLIQRQADTFIERLMGFDVRPHGYTKQTIDKVRSELFEYHKPAHQIEFLDRVIFRVNQGFENHKSVCPKTLNGGYCPLNDEYQDILFFVQNEVDKIYDYLTPGEFSKIERQNVSEGINKILEDLNIIKLSHELTYDDFQAEFQEMKDLYFLNKKTWLQLLTGKLSEMVKGGVIGETVSKQIIQTINGHSQQL